MRLSIRKAAAAIAGSAALVLSAGLATSASAATTPDPSGPEYFALSISTFNPNGTVNAFGPVAGSNGTVQTPSATQAVFSFSHGNVVVWHSAEPAPTINWKACTASVYQVGSWKFVYGTRQYWGARGFGHFVLKEVEVFKRYGNHCSAANPKAQPVYFQVKVRGYGFASLPGHH
jgi:hypothetical protein